ncbi:unnamed protein product [Schistocephalus solidus]|uniref:TPR_REGION domain-containing protein n=1 Tax=Schistocephalus solidus TaxID=70667 RepID=A0A183SJL2_SCHSO|nr:unnamed protein product [Schistocephalus solidus]
MKSDRKYEEAIRCYIQALKLDPNNLQVLRDLSVLQMHTRDLEGCKVQTGIEPYNYEHSELLLYYITILVESKRFDEALSFMESCTKDVVDHVTYLETHGDEFVSKAHEFLQHNLRRGVPTLFVQLKRFYNSPEKVASLESLYLTYRKNLDLHGTLGPLSSARPTSKSEECIPEPPSTSLWLNYLLASHFNHIGQVQGSSTAAAYLSEMQCMWFLIENALALRTMKRYGEALKLCHEIDRHYSAVLEDQLDFHSYCLRKGTLRAYVETVRLEDRLRDHPAYFNAASLAIEMYLFLHLNPLGEETETVDQPGSNMPSSELKKIRNKQRRAERRAEAEAQRSKADQERREQGQRSRQNADREAEADKPPEVEELDPKKLARPDDALSEAARFLQPLVEHSSSRIETHCLAYEIYERKEKWLLMLRSIRRGLILPGAVDHPWFNECTVRFLHRLTQLPKLTDKGGALVNEVLLEEVRSVFSIPAKSPLPDPLKYNEEFIQRNSKSFMHVFRGTLTKAIVDSEFAASHLKQLPSPSAEDLGEINWDVLFQALELLKRHAALRMAPVTDDLMEDFRAACAKRFPLAAVFLTPSEWEGLRKSVIEASYESALYGVYPQNTAAGDAERSNVVDNELTSGLKAVSLAEHSVVNGSSGGGAAVDSPPVNNAQPYKAKGGKRKKGAANKGKDPASAAAV